MELVMPYSLSVSLKAPLAYWAAPVAVEQHPGVLVRVALEPGDAQRVDDDVRRHVLAQRPAHHLAAEQVNDHGQKQPALISGDVREILLANSSG
jgi:hypothetical protein